MRGGNMRYGIMINLDYDSNPYDHCREIWQSIRNGMVEAGFRIEGRLFTIQMPPEDACELARSVIEQVDSNLSYSSGIFAYLREFYGYDNSNTINLMLPPSDNFEILEN